MDDLRDEILTLLYGFDRERNLASDVADEIMKLIEEKREEDCRSTVLDIETRQQ